MSSMNPLPSILPTPKPQAAPKVATPKATNPEAIALAERLQALQIDGHSYLDAPIQVAIASKSGTVQDALNVARTMKSSLANVPPAINHIFSEPQLQKAPTLTQQLSYWFNSSTGGLPITQNDLTRIQKDMIKAGQAKGLEVTGTWSPEWQSALSDAVAASYTKPGLGNVDSKSTVHTLIQQGLLSTALNSVYAVVKSMPRSVLQMAGDLVANIPTAISGDISAPTGKLNPFQKAGQAIANAQIFPGKPSKKQSDIDFEKASIDRTIQDIGTMLTFVPVGKLAFGSASVIGNVAAKGATTIVPLAEVAPKYTILKSIQASAAAGTEAAFPKIFPRVVANSPAMAWIYRGVTSGIAKTAPLQITARNAFAQRLRLPIVQGANAIAQKTILAGALETGIARGTGKLDQNAQDSPLNTALNNLHPISGPLGLAFDIFSMQANPAGITKPSLAEYAADIASGSTKMRQALDDTGALIAWQKANPDLNLEELIAVHGAPYVYQHITDQINQMAALHASDLVLDPLKAAGPNGEWAMLDDAAKLEKQLNVANDVWTNSAGKNSALAQARESILLDQNALETGFRSIRAMAGADTRVTAGVGNFNNLMKARKLGEQLLVPETQKFILHPGTIRAFKAAEDQTDVAPWFTETAKAAAGEKPTLNARWAEMNNPDIGRGMFGLARKDTLTKSQAYLQANKFQEALDAAGTAEQQTAIKLEIARYLVENFGIDTRSINYLDAKKTLDVLFNRADRLAVDIYPVAGAPKAVKDLFKQINDLGYKPIAGTDIGHYFTKDIPGVDLGVIGRKTTAGIASKLGISPRLSDSHAVSARASVEMQIQLQKTIDDGIASGKIQLPPGYNAPRVLSWLRKGLDEQRKLTIGQKGALFIAENVLAPLKAGGYKYEIQQLITSGAAKSQEEAMGIIATAKKSEMGLRDASKKELIAALTRPMDGISAELMGVAEGTPFMNKASANELIKTIWKARLAVPSEMIGGLAKFEDLLYAGMGIAGKEIPGLNGMTVPNLTASALNFRNRVRFQESLLFAWRRVFKTSAKGITEGVPPTFYPAQKMREMGIDQVAEKIYQEAYPKDNLKNMFLDDIERITNQADLFNIYSPRDYYKWTAYWIHEQGFRGEDLVKKVEKVMSYGERTAAERSLNAVFYPFSFNKTVMRQFGSYLLSKPAHRVMLGGMMAAYDNLDGQKKLKWWEDNLPLIKEMEKLNALKHGIGLGGFGGINMPYSQFTFNVFASMVGPKTISYSEDPVVNANTVKWIEGYVPLLKSIHDLTTEGVDTTLTIANGTLKTFGIKAKGSDTQPTPERLMPAQAQQNNAWDYRSRLVTGLTDVLDYNYKHPNAPITWAGLKNNDGQTIPASVGILDKAVNKTTIGQLVHYRYPAWDNTLSGTIAQKKATEADRFIGEVTTINPQLGATYRQLQDYALKVNNVVAKDNISPATLNAATVAFRSAAIELAVKDPNFYKFYKTHYEHLFGPLEGFNK